MIDEHRAWLNNLQAGDEVIVSSGWSDRIETVDKVTATQVVIGTQRFNKSDGYLRSSNRYSIICIEKPTQERRDNAYLVDAKLKIKHLKVDELTLDQCRKILAIAKGTG